MGILAAFLVKRPSHILRFAGLDVTHCETPLTSQEAEIPLAESWEPRELSVFICPKPSSKVHAWCVLLCVAFPGRHVRSAI